MAAQEHRVKSPVKPGSARCDYCGCEVPERYVDGTFPNRAFLDTGCYACDACLLRESKAGVKDRFEAAALERRGISVHRMEAEFTHARGETEISAAQVARSHLDRARSLYAEGEVVAAMEAAQAAWHASEVLHVGIELGPLARRDAKRQAAAGEGGRNKSTPAWHEHAITHAKTLLATGRASHELTSLCARKFGKSDDAMRRVLQAARLVTVRKSRAK